MELNYKFDDFDYTLLNIIEMEKKSVCLLQWIYLVHIQWKPLNLALHEEPKVGWPLSLQIWTLFCSCAPKSTVKYNSLNYI